MRSGKTGSAAIKDHPNSIPLFFDGALLLPDGFIHILMIKLNITMRFICLEGYCVCISGKKLQQIMRPYILL